MKVVLVLQMNIVWHFGKKDFHRFHETVHVARRDRIGKLIYGVLDLIGKQSAAIACQIGLKSPLDLQIREAQSVGCVTKTLHCAVDGEVSRLHQQCQRIQTVDFVSIKGQVGDRGSQRLFQIEALLLHQFQQEGWRAGRKPVVLELAIRLEKLRQRDWIVNCLGVFFKAITIVPSFDFLHELIAVASKYVKTVAEVSFQFLLRIAEHRCKTRIHRDIGQVIQIGEQRDMAELTDTGDK